MQIVAENYRKLLEEIRVTAEHYGRNPSDIGLVAVSKGFPWEKVQSAYDAGCRDFGESKVAEGLSKIALAPHDIHWHMIGTVQKNKVSKVLGNFALIHSIDTFELALKISESSQAFNLVTPILLQVNTSGEATKHGMDENGWRQVFETLLRLQGIKIEGLMTIAPFVDDSQQIGRCFARLRKFREECALLAGPHADMRHLSMGMSHDYPIAIAEGATLLRVGTAIFGKR